MLARTGGRFRPNRAEIGMENNPLRDQFLTNFYCRADWLSCSMEVVSVMRERTTVKAPGTGAVATKKTMGRTASRRFRHVGNGLGRSQ